MRLVHVASSYPLDDFDGSAPFMSEMLEALAARDHQVKVVVPRVKGLVEGVRNGVEVVGAPYAPSRFQTWGFGRSLDRDGRIRISAVALTPIVMTSMARVLRSLVHTFDPHVVHLHWVLPQGALVAALPKRHRVVVSAHGADARIASGVLSKVARSVLRRTDALVAASSEMLRVVDPTQNVAPAKRYVIHHGANSNLFGSTDRATARRLLGIPDPQTVLLAVGRLVAKKGFLTAIEAMSEMSSDDAHLYIVGDGPQGALLASKATDDRTHMIGKRTREEVANWFAACDLVVVPGTPDRDDVDSGPVVLVEALAAGRAIVTTPVGMAPELIEDESNGIVIDDLTPQSLAGAIERALLLKAALEPAARATFLRLGGWDRVASQLESVYEDVISRRS